MQLITRPDFTQADLAEFGNLPPSVRNEVDDWLKLLAKVTKPIQRSLEAAARQMGVSAKTARKKFDDFRKGCVKGDRVFEPGDWRVLINYSKVPAVESALTPEFIEWFKQQAEKNKRKTRPQYRQFVKAWREGKEIPGLDNSLPRHCPPPGVGYDNLMKKIRDEFSKLAMRRGLGVAVAKCGPQIFSTRANLWVGSHIMIDDMWHDNFVVFGRQIVRVLELDALDVFSGKLLTHGTKPRFRRDDGTMDGLKEKFAGLLVTGLFFNEGYSPRGTIVLAELGTAALEERIARILFDRTGGLIRLRENGITGQEQAILTGRMYENGSRKIVGQRGQGKGNPRFKAALESLRNLKHNELGALQGQTGKDSDHRPEQTHGQLKECEDLLKAMAVMALKNPARARQLQLTLMDYHADFCPLLIDVYREINDRTWHDLEGWHAAGNVIVELNDAGNWTRAENLLPAKSDALMMLAQADPKNYLRQRKLSPTEVYQRGRGDLLKLPMFVVGEILGDDHAREDMTVKGAYFNEISDRELSPEPMRFESVVLTPDGERRQLPDGKYKTFINPFDPRWLFVHDANDVCLGIAPIVERIDRGDDKQLQQAFGNRARRMEELLKPIRARHAQTVREETKRVEHNARVLDTSKPFTPQEIERAEFVKEHGPDAAAALTAKEEGAETSTGDDFLNALNGK